MVTSTTPSTTVQAWNAVVDLSFPSVLCVLQSGYKIKASTHNAETFNIMAMRPETSDVN